MSVEEYSIVLLSLDECPVQRSPIDMIRLLIAWRKHHSFTTTCINCSTTLTFRGLSYTTCCEKFYYNSHLKSYPVQSIAVPTPGYSFGLPVLKRMLRQANMKTNQDFLVIPDPIYWQMQSTLMYEKVMKFVQGLPITNKTKTVLPTDKVDIFYKQMLEVPLNYGSMQCRSSGKNAMSRRVAFGKRCTNAMRGMIVPDPLLPSNQIRLPIKTINAYHLAGKWIILNRMPSLQPGNFIALQVASEGWEYDCFGIPLEVVQALNADFDGDECNLYLIPNPQSQAECAMILNPESELGCFVMQGPKLTPTQDMLVAYYLKYDDINFLPYKNPSLSKTFRVLYDLYGSKQAFEYIDRMRRFYLDELQNNTCFALTFEEMEKLSQFKCESEEEFERMALQVLGNMSIQILSGAKGTFLHLSQFFHVIGNKIKSSYYEGIPPHESIHHAKESMVNLSTACKIWEPGYSYSKMAHSMQGLHVDYGGRLLDGETVIENDVLDVLHYTDVMSPEGFQHLMAKTFEGGS